MPLCIEPSSVPSVELPYLSYKLDMGKGKGERKGNAKAQGGAGGQESGSLRQAKVGTKVGGLLSDPNAS